MLAITLTLTILFCYIVGAVVSTVLLARREWKNSMRRYPSLYNSERYPEYNPEHPSRNDYLLGAIASVVWPVGFPVAWMT